MQYPTDTKGYNATHFCKLSQAKPAKQSQASSMVFGQNFKKVLLKFVGAAAKRLKVFLKPVGSLTQTVKDSVGSLGRCCPNLYMFSFITLGTACQHFKNRLDTLTRFGQTFKVCLRAF